VTYACVTDTYLIFIL